MILILIRLPVRCHFVIYCSLCLAARFDRQCYMGSFERSVAYCTVLVCAYIYTCVYYRSEVSTLSLKQNITELKDLSEGLYPVDS